MSAVDEIQAAIDKLTALKAESTRGPWHDWTNDLTDDVEVWHDQEQRLWVAGCGLDDSISAANARLIATLHATVDAQLAILREGLEQAEITVSPDEDDEIAIFLGLARSINGSAS